VAAVEDKGAGAALAGAPLTAGSNTETNSSTRAITATVLVSLVVVISSALSLDEAALSGFSATCSASGKNKDADHKDQCIGLEAGIHMGQAKERPGEIRRIYPQITV
jgi:hypothetical protein